MVSRLFVVALFTCNILASELVSRTKVQMYTFVSLSAPKEHAFIMEQGFRLIDKIEANVSSFKPQSTVSRLNRHKSIHADNHTLALLALSQRLHVRSDGFFDISVGALSKDIYRFGSDNKEVNSSALDKRVVGAENITIKANEVTLDNDIKIDFGGIAKGYAVDEVYKLYADKQIEQGIIKLSGDIRCISSCILHLTDPFHKEQTFAKLHTKEANTSISTSGNYERYIASKKFNHLINPKTKRSQQNFASITLIAKVNNAELDAMATAIAVMPKDKAFSLLQKSGYGYIIYDTDQHLYLSDNLASLITLDIFDASK